MILLNHYQTQAPVCMQMTPVSSANMRSLAKLFSSICQCFIDNKLPIHFGEEKTRSIIFSKTRGLNEINISFSGHSIK